MKKNKLMYMGPVLSLSALISISLVQPIEVVAQGEDLLTKERAAMVEVEEKREALALLIDDEIVSYLNSQEDYDQLLDKIKIRYTSLNSGSLVKDLSIEPQISKKIVQASPGQIVSVDQAMETILQGGRRQAIYIAKEGDSIEEIGKSFSMSQEELVDLNPGLDNGLKEGREVIVFDKAPMIEVTSEEVSKWNEEIPFETEIRLEPTLFKGQSKVYVEGKPGQKEITSHINKRDGQVESYYLSSVRIISEPVTQVILEGTKEKPAAPDFISPAQGRLTSRFGPRWGRMHQGIDVANSVGTNIKASRAGVVTKAGPAGTYGNLIIIDHGNGMTTRYAHLSEVLVKQGQRVEQGQLIGKMGSTGRSTGSHLHFEVRSSGKALNPLNYVKY